MESSNIKSELQHNRLLGSMKKVLISILATVFLAACVEQKDIEFFSKTGVVVGVPSLQVEGGYFLPITFKSKIMHSAQWLYDVKHEVVGSEIRITALYSVPPNAEKSVYKNDVVLEGIKQGVYDIYYVNKDKTKNYIGKVKVDHSQI